MTEQVFQLLGQYPLVSIIGGFVLAIVLAFILQDQIRDYVKKKFNLYTKEEVMAKATESLYAAQRTQTGFVGGLNIQDTHIKRVLNKLSDRLK